MQNQILFCFCFVDVWMLFNLFFKVIRFFFSWWVQRLFNKKNSNSLYFCFFSLVFIIIQIFLFSKCLLYTIFTGPQQSAFVFTKSVCLSIVHIVCSVFVQDFFPCGKKKTEKKKRSLFLLSRNIDLPGSLNLIDCYIWFILIG